MKNVLKIICIAAGILFANFVSCLVKLNLLDMDTATTVNTIANMLTNILAAIL